MFLDDDSEFGYVGRLHNLRDKTLASIPFLYQRSRLYEFKLVYLNFLGWELWLGIHILEFMYYSSLTLAQIE
jgi:hypothetical protein